MQEKELGIRVLKKNAEDIRRKLIELSILKAGLIPRNEDKTVTFPITSDECLPIELKQFLIYQHFEKRAKKLSYAEKLKDIIPHELHSFIPRSVDLIGEIAIAKIPPELVKYGVVVGQTLVETVPSCKVVYAKESDVRGEYRVFQLKHLYGTQLTQTVHREHGIQIFVDLKEAYFNPRLANEHQRVASLVQTGEIVIDAFTGVGPFALHIATKTDAKIVAIDLNSSAIECLRRSMDINKRHLIGTIVPVVGDARPIFNRFKAVDRIIMNLPEKANEFFEEAVRSLRSGGTIHLYSFIMDEKRFNGSDPLQKEVEEICKRMGRQIVHLNILKLRDISPTKRYICLDIQVE